MILHALRLLYTVYCTRTLYVCTIYTPKIQSNVELKLIYATCWAHTNMFGQVFCQGNLPDRVGMQCINKIIPASIGAQVKPLLKHGMTTALTVTMVILAYGDHHMTMFITQQLDKYLLPFIRDIWSNPVQQIIHLWFHVCSSSGYCVKKLHSKQVTTTHTVMISYWYRHQLTLLVNGT